MRLRKSISGTRTLASDGGTKFWIGRLIDAASDPPSVPNAAHFRAKHVPVLSPFSFPRVRRRGAGFLVPQAWPCSGSETQVSVLLLGYSTVRFVPAVARAGPLRRVKIKFHVEHRGSQADMCGAIVHVR